MSHSRNLICGGLSLLLVSSAGCAGKGLRNMFSRNETDGYSTIEELEAAENGSAEKHAAVVDAGEAEPVGPRFASWIPFTGTRTEDAEAVAANEASAEENEAVAAWHRWQNPFRRDRASETDPFLTDETVPESMFARKEDPAERTDREPAFGKPARTVSEDRLATGGTQDDRLLVDKFEEHFKQNTAETAEAVEQAEPLIVAGKKSTSAGIAETPSSVDAIAEDKLAELERILNDKKSAVIRRNQRAKEFARDDAAELQQVAASSDQSAEFVRRSARQRTGARQDSASRAESSFDNLLDSATEVVAASAGGTLKKSGTRSRQSSQVSVAEAESLFGESVRGAIRRSDGSSRHRSEDRKDSGRSVVFGDGDGFRWAQSQLGTNDAQGTERAQHAIQSTVDQFATMFHSRHAGDVVPPAMLKDAPETAFLPVGASVADRHSAAIARAAGSSVRLASTAREFPAGNAQSGMSQDPFFSDNGAESPSAQTSPTLVKVVSSSKESTAVGAGGSAVSFRSRNWLLLIGGIIVVALLFAPSRRKRVQADHASLQG